MSKAVEDIFNTLDQQDMLTVADKCILSKNTVTDIGTHFVGGDLVKIVLEEVAREVRKLALRLSFGTRSGRACMSAL